MASVFLYHVVGDLTVGKPELSEFLETETVASAIQAIGNAPEGALLLWKKRSQNFAVENAETRQQRFVGILNALDIVAFLARDESLADQDKALKTLVSQVVVPNNATLSVVDPGTRLIDALEMMKQGVKRLLVPKSHFWRGMSKRFSIIYNGKWLKNGDTLGINTVANAGWPSQSCSTSSTQDKFCCLAREDVLRFLLGCLGALAPIPLSSISSVKAINPNYSYIEASSPAIQATKNTPHDPSAVAVVEPTPDGRFKIIGDISSVKLWKCDYSAAAWSLANLSAGQFVMGVEDHTMPRSDSDMDRNEATNLENGGGAVPTRARKFSSRSIGFFSNSSSVSVTRNMYRGRSAPLTCKTNSSLAAVMAQMLSHRATHVWVTDVEKEDYLVGVVGYSDILGAVTRQPPVAVADNASS